MLCAPRQMRISLSNVREITQPLNWQVLRRSYATWMSQAQVNVKDAQGLMRHSRASTTQDVYQQVVPESQRKAVQKLSATRARIPSRLGGQKVYFAQRGGQCTGQR